jgi:hypothetical protein
MCTTATAVSMMCRPTANRGCTVHQMPPVA